MKTKIYALLALMMLVLVSCEQELDEDFMSRERNILGLKLQGQLGNPIIERDDSQATIKIFIMDVADYPYREVALEGLVLSKGATADVTVGQTLDFYNPQRQDRITVISESGERQVWKIELEAYDAFFAGTWRIEDLKIYIDQNLTGVGTAMWETQMSGSEFGYFATPEYDDRIHIEMSPEMQGDNFVGTLVHDPGEDGEFGSFMGIFEGEYSLEDPLNMNPRLRHLIPPGESTWTLNPATNEMKITQNNITSTMTFGEDDWGNTLFEFRLPDVSGEPEGTNFYNNFWRSSYKFTYIVRQVNE